jgi:hypothetical protein
VKVTITEEDTGKQQKPGRVEQMIKSSLSQFVDRVSHNRHIAADDVKVLLRSVLEDGLISREEAETLLALDRTFDAHESWGDALVTLVVDYVVWGARPTGSVTAEDARWLAAALEFDGPTETGMRIAYAVVDEAQTTDEALVDFIMRGRQLAKKTLAA